MYNLPRARDLLRIRPYYALIAAGPTRLFSSDETRDKKKGENRINSKVSPV